MGGNDRVNIPDLTEPLLSFKDFQQMQNDPLDSTDNYKLYEEYKNDHFKKQAEIFYESHKSDSWFLEKYHPLHSYKLKVDQNQ